MRVFLFTVFSLILQVQAQEHIYVPGAHAFHYRMMYSEIGDTLKITRVEDFVLYTDGQKSLFSSEKNILRDSILAIHRTEFNQGKRSFSMAGIERPNFTYYIEKTRINEPVRVYDQIGGKNFMFEEAVQSEEWQLSTENKIIDGQRCLKATIRQFGRDWTAWYAPHIPVSDGPYKFRGLPGLIVDIYDENLHFRFKLIKYNPKDRLVLSLPEYRYYKMTITDRYKFMQGKSSYAETLVERARAMGLQLTEQRARQLRENSKKQMMTLEQD